MTIMPDKVQFLCSCSQYVHGSGKPTKKKTTCKQCKGIKLPFIPIGGTVRLFSTPYVLDAAVTRNCFGTVRFPPTYENRRSTILCRENDPYNFLRQSRLLTTDRTNDQKLQQRQKFQTKNVLIGPNHMFVNKTTRTIDSVSPPEFHYNPSMFQTTINPYELISSTLHNNEFSTSNLYNMMRKYKATSKNPETTVLQNRNDAFSFNNLDLCIDNRTTVETTKPISVFNSSQPPPPPAVESLPLSIKSVPNKIIHNTETGNSMQKGLKKIMKETKSARIENGTLLTGRFKKVQFNTLPELTRPKILTEFQKDFDQNHSKSKQDEDYNLTTEQKNHTGMKKFSQRRNPVMRSMSDRRNKDSKESLYFKDTTALRTKPNRASPHQLFLKANSTLRLRPSCPPPSCPKGIPAKDPEQSQIIQNENAPQRPPRQQKQQNKKLLNKAVLSDETKASRIFGLLPVSTISKNKTTIEPFSKTMNTLNKEQKTSITINIDDRSTVNVNDRVELYHSSVLIKSGTDSENQKELEITTENQTNHENDNAAAFDKAAKNLNKTKTLIYIDDTSNSHNDEVVTQENVPSDMQSTKTNIEDIGCDSSIIPSKYFTDSFILKLLNDPFLSHLLYGLEIKSIANIIENSLIKMRTNKYNYNFTTRSTKDTDTDTLFVNYLHEIIKEERSRYDSIEIKLNDNEFNENNKVIPVGKLHNMLTDHEVWKNGECSIKSDMHQYESICFNCDPIYEEINEKPPPLPTSPPPILTSTSDENYKPMFLGATKYEILSYLVDAKDRVPEEPYSFKFQRRSTNEIKCLEKVHEFNRKTINIKQETSRNKNEPGLYETNKCMTSIERNDSGVGSETSKTSRTKYQPGIIENKKIQPIHLCEDCDEAVELYGVSDIYLPMICKNCSKKRTERREILWEFIETEKKYTRDLQIIIDEFYRPMLVAGLLTQEQLAAIFLNIEELLQNSESFCRKIREALDAANDQGDDDLFTVDIGQIILETSSMLSAFETYCVQQAASSLLLANLEKDKELLKIFLRVSQMENTVLRRMNLNSFLMVPVQRVTKYPLLLARLYKVTPPHLEGRERLKEAREKIEIHLNRMNREAKDISTKLWRRLSSNQSRSREYDIANIKLRKIAMDCLDWNYEKVHFIIEGKLLITQPTDNNWRKGKTIKLTPVNALLITNELTSPVHSDHTIVSFPRYSQTKVAAFILIREKSGRYTMYREPFFLDRCVVCTESDEAEYFEVHEISTKDIFIFKAENDVRTKHWYNQLQHHAQATGAWRRRRTALANIMINGMMIRQ